MRIALLQAFLQKILSHGPFGTSNDVKVLCFFSEQGLDEKVVTKAKGMFEAAVTKHFELCYAQQNHQAVEAKAKVEELVALCYQQLANQGRHQPHPPASVVDLSHAMGKTATEHPKQCWLKKRDKGCSTGHKAGKKETEMFKVRKR